MADCLDLAAARRLAESDTENWHKFHAMERTILALCDEIERLRNFPDHGTNVMYDPETCPCQRCHAGRRAEVAEQALREFYDMYCSAREDTELLNRIDALVASSRRDDEEAT